jgi:NNP family nitrate/nitrite transporter-like MFS transporter
MTENRVSRKAIIVLVALWLGQFSHSLASSSFRVILPLIMDGLKLTYTEAGLIGSLEFTVYMLMQVPSGFVVDRFGARKTITLGVLGGSIGNFLFGLSTNFSQALMCRLLVGLALAFIFVPGHKAIVDWFPPRRRGMAMGFFAGGGAGMSVASVLSPFLALTYSWGLTIIILSLLGFFASAILWISVVENSAGAASPKTRSWKGDLLIRLIRSKIGIVLMAIQFIRGALIQAPNLWLVTFLFTDRDFSLPLAGLALAVFAVLSIPSGVVGGGWSDRMASRMSISILSSAILTVGFIALAFTHNRIVLWVLIVFIGWFVVLYRPALFAIVPELYGEASAGVSIGLHNTIANLGAVVLAFLMGLLRDLTGSFEIGWLILGVLSALSLILSLWMRNPKGEEAPQAL